MHPFPAIRLEHGTEPLQLCPAVVQRKLSLMVRWMEHVGKNRASYSKSESNSPASFIKLSQRGDPRELVAPLVSKVKSLVGLT